MMQKLKPVMGKGAQVASKLQGVQVKVANPLQAEMVVKPLSLLAATEVLQPRVAPQV